VNNCVWSFSNNSCSYPFVAHNCSDINNITLITNCFYDTSKATPQFSPFDNTKQCSAYSTSQEQCEKAIVGCIYNSTSNACLNFNASALCSTYTDPITCTGYKSTGNSTLGRCTWL